MITQSNLKEVINLIDTESLNNAINDSGDYLLLNLYIFNVGATAEISSVEYSEDIEQEANDNGNLFIDKDNFLQLLSDYNIKID
jgi:hypothetical protein